MNEGGCPLCGAKVSGGVKECTELFERLLARSYGDPRFGAVHLLAVDAYVLQHSEQHGPRSNAYHLLRLFWLLKKNGEPKLGQNGRPDHVIKGYRDFPFLEPPRNRGQVTVVDVAGIDDLDEYAKRVREWAEAVFEAWEIYHGWVLEHLKRV